MSTRSGVRRPSFDAVTAPIPFYLPVSFLVLGLVTFAALVILMIGARSPYTHANLSAGYDARYDRTQQITVGPGEPYEGVSPAGRLTGDAVSDGARLFVTKGCVTCHALEARGGVVGPAIAGSDADTVLKKVRKGPSGMPQYSPETLTDDEVAAIAAYLRSLAAPGSK
ncbi:MAG TPA: cytochrome c [Candidatus Limnocylindria bacterium]|nr:cytochrome c [Candidatus Limnocylindria bacterium]